MANPFFDATYYLAQNTDVADVYGNDAAAAEAHYYNHGAAEGRKPVQWFDGTYYAETYSDLSVLSANQLFDHFVNSGIIELRSPVAGVNLDQATFGAYAAANEDLVTEYGIDDVDALTDGEIAALAKHFFEHGINEDRPGAPEIPADPTEPGEPSDIAEALAKITEAQEARKEAVEELEAAVDAVAELADEAGLDDDAVTGFEGVTADELEVYSADAAALVADVRLQLAAARQGTSDQALREAVATEQADVTRDPNKYDATGAVSTTGEYSARDLQVRAESALAAANAHSARNGTDLEFAAKLDQAIAAYLNVSPDVGDEGVLRLVQTAYNDVLAAIETAEGDLEVEGVVGALGLWKTAVDIAIGEVFEVADDADRDDVDADDSILDEDVAAAAALESALLSANTRFELQENAIVTEYAFSGVELEQFIGSDAVVTEDLPKGTAGANLRSAQDSLEGRNELIKLLEDARGAEASVNGAIESLAAADATLEEVAEELGFEIVEVENGFEYGNDEPNLFVVGEDTPAIVIISDFGADDALYLGANVAQGDLEDANNNVVEFFLDSNAAGDAVIKVENSAYSSATEDFTEITLTGVSLESLTVDGGLISITETVA